MSRAPADARRSTPPALSDSSRSTPPRSLSPDSPDDYLYADEQTISGLTPDTKYYVRLVATNSDGTTTSDPAEFSTIGRLVITMGQRAGPVTFDSKRDLLISAPAASSTAAGGWATG